MKILLVNAFYAPEIVGGAELSCQLLAEQLTRMGHKVVVLCSSKQCSRDMIAGIEVIRLESAGKVGGAGPAAKLQSFFTNAVNIGAVKKYKEILQELAPDVLHSNTLYGISPSIWMAASRLNIPIVHTTRDFSLYNQKIVGKWMSRYVQAFAPPSNYMKDFFLEKGFFAFAEHVQMIYNAMPLDRELFGKQVKNKLQKSSSQINFVYVGRYEDYKGVLWLLRCFEQVKCSGITLHLYGKGPLEQEVNRSAKQSKGKIINHGFLSPSELQAEMMDKDVVIAPSLWEEPFGRMVLDAYQNGMPVIVTQSGGLPELVNNNSGIIIPKNDDSAMQQAIEYYSEYNNIQHALPGIESMLNRFDVINQAKQFERLYSSFL